ncbi:hypothetical protein, partial [Sansalvadorimonas verongulae]|uniref:hypothetical protein n=1 Tax=Sansalvadorimonas verongulae TaxID=2172824 RepID=UPI001E5D106A
MFNDALDAVTQYLKTALAEEAKDVESHPGRFTQQELARLLTKKRAVRIAIEQSPNLNVTGQGFRDVTLIMAAYVICSDAKESDRHRGALAIVEKVLGELPYCRFGSDFLLAVNPRTVTAENLYSGEID